MTFTTSYPKKDPGDHVYTILQDHGPDDGGWGPVGVFLPGFSGPRPVVYTGDDPQTIERLEGIARMLAEDTGKKTIFARYSNREDLAVFGDADGS